MQLALDIKKQERVRSSIIISFTKKKKKIKKENFWLITLRKSKLGERLRLNPPD